MEKFSLFSTWSRRRWHDAGFSSRAQELLKHFWEDNSKPKYWYVWFSDEVAHYCSCLRLLQTFQERPPVVYQVPVVDCYPCVEVLCLPVVKVQWFILASFSSWYENRVSSSLLPRLCGYQRVPGTSVCSRYSIWLKTIVSYTPGMLYQDQLLSLDHLHDAVQPTQGPSDVNYR